MKKQGSEYTWFIYTLWQSPSEAKWYDAHIFSSCKLRGMQVKNAPKMKLKTKIKNSVPVFTDNIQS